MADIQIHKITKLLAHLPNDLVLDNILPRLPIQTILRFKLVCKSWYNTISSLEFVKTRFNCKSTLPMRLLLCTEMNDNPRMIFSLSYDKNSNKLINLAELSCNGISEYQGNIYLIDSCNGLVCLNLFDNKLFSIWNPTTQQYHEIPYCQQMLSTRKMVLTASAFGYSSLHNDYKIFAGFSKTSRSHMAYKSNLFFLFSFRSGIWKELTDIRGTHFQAGAGLWLKGKLYWPWNDYATRNVLGLFSFDLDTEEMKQISISTSFSKYGYKLVNHIFEIDGFLSISCFKEEEEPNHVWKMSRVEEVDSWVKVFEFESPNFCVFGFAGIGSCFAHFVGKLKLIDLKGDGIKDGGGGDKAYDSIEGIEYSESAGFLQSSSSFVESFGAFKIQAPSRG